VARFVEAKIVVLSVLPHVLPSVQGAGRDAAAEDLVGLWKAERVTGPSVRGALIIERGESSADAEIAGRKATVRFDGEQVRFELPGGEGSFRGRIDGDQIVGHWVQPPMTIFEWAERSTAPLRAWPPAHYGYLWWVKEDYPWRGSTVRSFYAAGNGGQIVMAIPDFDLVLGCFGGNYGDPVRFLFSSVYVPEWILPAVEED